MKTPKNNSNTGSKDSETQDPIKEKTSNTKSTESKNQEFRKFKIENFRNLGINEPAILELNRSLKKEHIGDVVYLVGPNNSGKSNVIDAIRAYGRGTTEERDRSDFLIHEKKDPTISLLISDAEKRYTLSSIENENVVDPQIILHLNQWSRSGGANTILIPESRDREEIIEFTREEFIAKIENAANKSVYKKLLDGGKHQSLLNNRVGYNGYIGILCEIINYILRYGTVDKHPQGDLAIELMTMKDEASDEFYKKYNYDLHPNIIYYNQKPLKQTDMQCDPQSPNHFISNVLRVMGVNEEIMASMYNKSVESAEPDIRKQFEDALNEEVEEKINKRFNNLYMCGNHGKYSFRFRFEKTEFSLGLRLGRRSINLDKQSTGFKWFFDFYFNFICTGELKHGDIILMDEPGTNLQIAGQIELRKYLKEFAKEQGLTFVICTHSPFLIDCDYLDEVRILTRDDKTGYVNIRNKFTVIEENETDTLDRILVALTIGRHILIDPEQRTVFVEGITDYNYLTAFKILFGPKFKRLTFLPINGTKRKDLFEMLLKIERLPTLLVDGDAEGIDVKKRAEDTGVRVVCLDDESIGYKTIENLFTVEDRREFDLYNKSWDLSSIFKNNIVENTDKISDTTKKRFEGLLEDLLD